MQRAIFQQTNEVGSKYWNYILWSGTSFQKSASAESMGDGTYSVKLVDGKHTQRYDSSQILVFDDLMFNGVLSEATFLSRAGVTVDNQITKREAQRKSIADKLVVA